LAMLATAIFDHLFIKSNISAMDGLVVVKFYTDIENRWFFGSLGRWFFYDTKENNGYRDS